MAEEKWFLTTKKADFTALGNRFGIDPVIARIIRNRDLISEAEFASFLEGTLSDIPESTLLKDMDIAIDVFQRYRDEKVRIIGDYDIDGVCSSYILVRGLRELRCNVDAAIPHRIQDGYGLNERLIDEAHEDGVSLIITCDNGISAAAQIAHARELGMHVIVTDHHEVPFEIIEGKKKQILPKADAVIDPKRDDCSYPTEGICGGFVAYHFIRALYERLEYENKNLMNELTEIVAFATVGDVMELRAENRILVKEGLKLMQRSGNLGLRSLIRICGLGDKVVSAYHLGFVLGPCLNATGRLDTAIRALELLLETDERRALSIATELKEMNDSRKDLTQKGVEKALEQMVHWDLTVNPVIVLFLPEVHESLAGIIAGKIKERFNHPTFVLTRGEEGVKGSGRSVEGYDMFEALCEVKELLGKFGGHTMAAGLSLKEENLEPLIQGLNRNCHMEAEQFVRKIHIDVNMPFSYVTDSFVEQLSVLEPFGNGNAKPVFGQSSLSFIKARKIGSTDKVMKFTVRDDAGCEAEMTCFTSQDVFDTYIRNKYSQSAVEQLYEGTAADVKLSVIYYPEFNEFRGKRSIQFVLQSYK